MARTPVVTSILVGELGPAEREELVLGRFQAPQSAEARSAAKRILDRAGGNPFYINEILESLVERGVLAPSRRGLLRWVRRDEVISVPTTGEAVVASRLDRLPDDERDTVRRAALLGRVFRVEDVAALLGGDPSSALVRLAARGLIVPSSPP